MIDYRQANATMRTTSGKRYPIEAYGDFPLTFRSSSGEVPLLLCNVAHVPSLSYQLLSLRVAADNGHTYTGNTTGVTVKFKTGETLFFPSVGRLNVLYAYRPGALIDENANALIAPDLSRVIGVPQLASAPSMPLTPMPTREFCARRPNRRASPSRESCTNARPAQW